MSLCFILIVRVTLIVCHADFVQLSSVLWSICSLFVCFGISVMAGVALMMCYIDFVLLSSVTKVAGVPGLLLLCLCVVVYDSDLIVFL